MRQAEVAAAELRDALKASASEALRRLIQAKLRDGMPLVDIREPILGLPGDGSRCGACDQEIAQHHLMVMIPSAALVPLHATDCFRAGILCSMWGWTSGEDGACEFCWREFCDTDHPAATMSPH